MCFWVIFPHPHKSMSRSLFPMFSSSSFIVSGLTFKSSIHFELIFYMEWDNGHILFFCIWITSFPNTFYYFFPTPFIEETVLSSCVFLAPLKKINWPGTSLVAQWLRICLPMQRTWVQALVREYPTCCGATKPVRHNYWACALEPVCHNYWACMPQLLKPSRLQPVDRKSVV